ncbi:tRNA (adenosine(37)-N6)-threonylcarbamoyltransferase complex dimerization subunit type 1 TsaB, partial [Alicyclobacillaceae bacterium I2511]
MAVLAVDTATQVLAAALGNGEELLGSHASLLPRGHSRWLVPALFDLLHGADVLPADLTGLVVGVGPGSYTGVRLGITTVKAMAVALHISVVSVSTLLALAEAVLPFATLSPVQVMPLLYARRQRAFGAIYEKQGHTWSLTVQPQVQPVSTWVEWASDRGHHDGVWVVHDFEPRFGVTPLLEQPWLQPRVHLVEVAGN